MPTKYPDPAGINWPPGHGSVIRIFRSADLDPDPKELFTDPEQCIPQTYSLYSTV